MQIDDIQEFCNNLLAKVAYPRIGTLIGLQEELGKLAKVIMDVEIYGKPFNRKLFEKECSEVFFSFIDLCNSYDVKLGKISKIRLEEIKKKIDKWEKEYSENLKDKRRKFD